MPADPPAEGEAEGRGVTVGVTVAVGVGFTVARGVTVGVGFTVADAVAALDEECAVADALGDDEDPVHPAAATQIRSAAHIAMIAACFFIKVIPRKNEHSL
jgi:hypothetical protein